MSETMVWMSETMVWMSETMVWVNETMVWVNETMVFSILTSNISHLKILNRLNKSYSLFAIA